VAALQRKAAVSFSDACQAVPDPVRPVTTWCATVSNAAEAAILNGCLVNQRRARLKNFYFASNRIVDFGLVYF
jgi:hypothetical protein